MKKPIYLLILLCFFSLSHTFGQTESYLLTFKARDYYTHDTISLDSVFVENPARNCDTTIYGVFPKLVLSWVTGVDEFTTMNSLQVAQNYPNPYAGSTKCTIKLPDKKEVNITLTNVHGKQLATLQKTLPAGTHTFTVETAASGIFFLTVSDGDVSKTLKLNSLRSSGKNNFRISYSGNKELPDNSKKSTQDRGFTFLPGDELDVTYYTSRYEEKSLNIQPSNNTTYINTLKPNYLSLRSDSIWGYAPIPATFTVLTNIPNLTAWSWDFGDGETSNLENPTHTYTTPGTYYTVSLTAQGDDGTYFATKQNYIHTLNEPAVVNFEASVTHGMVPMSVHFISHTDIQNPTMWIWSFGDGSTVQGVQNPYHSYDDVGLYTVSLTVGDNNGTTTKTRENYIHVSYCPSTVTDADGNVYNTIAIGSQCWMKENLNVGTRISGLTAQANNGVLEKFCFSGYESNCDTYGGYYQFGEFMQYNYTEGTQGICPNGWHIPTEDDFTILRAVADAAGTSGGSLKEPAFAHWNHPNTEADNLTSFTALGAGWLEMDYGYDPWWVSIKYRTYFGSSTFETFKKGYSYYALELYYESEFADFRVLNLFDAVSIRCIKDQQE
jgi:uncharacterized protein (TIGR02145 family)